jgi:hypothetical protein
LCSFSDFKLLHYRVSIQVHAHDPPSSIFHW